MFLFHESGDFSHEVCARFKEGVEKFFPVTVLPFKSFHKVTFNSRQKKKRKRKEKDGMKGIVEFLIFFYLFIYLFFFCAKEFFLFFFFFFFHQKKQKRNDYNHLTTYDHDSCSMIFLKHNVIAIKVNMGFIRQLSFLPPSFLGQN